MRLQRVSCRNPRHPARCMRSEPCLFSNPPEFQRAFPVPFRVGDARCFSASVMFRRFSRRSRRDDSVRDHAPRMVFAVSSPELTAVASSFPLAGNGSSPANVNGYYLSATPSLYGVGVRGGYSLSVTATDSSVEAYGTALYSVRCVRSVRARTGKPSFIAAACACFF